MFIHYRFLKVGLSIVLAIGLSLINATATQAASPANNNTIDTLASTLATQVLKTDKNADTALKTAILSAGFNIIKAENNKVLASPKANTNQGLAFDEWEVEGLQKSLNGGPIIPLNELAQLIVLTLPELKLQQQPISQLLIEDIRSQTQSSHPGLRFWARFIVELGKKRLLSPYNLMQPVDANKIQFNSLQLAFIERRLGADLENALKVQAKAKSIKAGFKLDCTKILTKDTVTDQPKASKIKGFVKFVKSLKDRGKNPVKISVSDSALYYLKLTLTIQALNAKFGMEGQPPLIRTKKTTQPGGEKKKLFAQFFLKPPNNKWHACARKILRLKNMDYKEGNFGGVEVNWLIIKDQEVLQWAAGELPLRRLIDKQTGITEITIEGKPQRKPLPQYVLPVEKQGEVWTLPQLKTLDIYKALKPIITNPPNPLNIPGEIFERTKSLSFAYIFPVRDWVPGTFHADGTAHTISKTKQSGATGQVDYQFNNLSADFGIVVGDNKADDEKNKIDHIEGIGTTDVVIDGYSIAGGAKVLTNGSGQATVTVSGTKVGDNKWNLSFVPHGTVPGVFTIIPPKGKITKVPGAIPVGAIPDLIKNVELKDGSTLYGEGTQNILNATISSSINVKITLNTNEQ